MTGVDRDNAQRVAEQLRIVLPQLAQHSLAVTPTNYAVFFEHITQSNAALCAEFDTLTTDGRHVSSTDCRRLFEQHLAPFSHQRLEEIRSAIHAVILELAGSLASADSGMASFGDSLAKFRKSLGRATTSHATRNGRCIGCRNRGHAQHVATFAERPG